MAVLLVGADRLGRIDDRLKELGFTEIDHYSGRSGGGRLSISPATEMIIVFVDFISHALANEVKKRAKRAGIPITFIRRSLSSLESPELIRSFIGRRVAASA